METDHLSSHNVLVVTFGKDPENDKNAYQALTTSSSSIRRARSRSPAALSSRVTSTAAFT